MSVWIVELYAGLKFTRDHMFENTFNLPTKYTTSEALMICTVNCRPCLQRPMNSMVRLRWLITSKFRIKRSISGMVVPVNFFVRSEADTAETRNELAIEGAASVEEDEWLYYLRFGRIYKGLGALPSFDTSIPLTKPSSLLHSPFHSAIRYLPNTFTINMFVRLSIKASGLLKEPIMQARDTSTTENAAVRLQYSSTLAQSCQPSP